MANTREQQSRAGRRQFRGFVRLFVPERVRRVMRVGTYVAVLFVVLAGVAANSAMGSVTEQALITGRQLSKLEDFTSSSSRLVLNGERMNIASATTTADVSAVLDRVEGVCKEDGTVARDFREIDSLMTDAKALAAAKKFRMGVLREERDGEGIVACAVRNPKNGDQNFVKGLMKFADSFDLADVGLLRYVYARRTDSGRTHVITVWTDGSFKFDSMLAPADGKDAPGSDPRNAPRPKDSVRFLTAAAEGAPHSVRIYESTAPSKDVLQQYDSEMPKRGWNRVPVNEEVPEARYYSRKGVDLMLVAYPNGDRTAVSMLEMRGN